MDASLPPWCSSRLPSVYGYIQREYWDVGLLRFYQDPSRVTRWIMVGPQGGGYCACTVGVRDVGGCVNCN